jgi:hypothetical protein
MKNFNITISKYSTAASFNQETTNILVELKNILSGKYEKEILICRDLYNAGDKIGYKKRKSFLPALTFSGQFKGSHKQENLNQYSNFIIIDIDSINKAIIEEIKKQLFQDKFIAAVWISPSGCGLKVLMAIVSSANDHKICFDTISKYLDANYAVEVDKSGSDVCRLCFVSYDIKLLMKDSFIPFDFREFYTAKVDDQKEKKKTIASSKEKKFVSTQLVSEKELFKGTENRNNQRNRDTMIKVIKYLRKNNLSITSNYQDWFRVACAVANSFTYDLGQKYYLELCRLDGALHDEYKSQHLLEYCYRNRRLGVVDFSTVMFLAKQKGFVVKK